MGIIPPNRHHPRRTAATTPAARRVSSGLMQPLSRESSIVPVPLPCLVHHLAVPPVIFSDVITCPPAKIRGRAPTAVNVCHLFLRRVFPVPIGTSVISAGPGRVSLALRSVAMYLRIHGLPPPLRISPVPVMLRCPLPVSHARQSPLAFVSLVSLFGALLQLHDPVVVTCFMPHMHTRFESALVTGAPAGWEKWCGCWYDVVVRVCAFNRTVQRLHRRPRILEAVVVHEAERHRTRTVLLRHLAECEGQIGVDEGVAKIVGSCPVVVARIGVVWRVGI